MPNPANNQEQKLNALDLADTAALLCLTKRQVQNLVELGLPKHGSGKGSYFVWPEVFAWYLSYKIDCAKRPDGPGGPTCVVDGEDYDQALTRRTIAEANLKELQLAQERGEVVAVEDVEKNIAAIATNIRAKMLAMPAKLTSILAGMKQKPQIRAVLDSEIRQILNELVTANEASDV